MVASLVLTEKYNIGVNAKGKVKVADHLLATSEIPFIRYRFESYGPDELEYIKKSMEKFTQPVHLAEVTIGPNSESEIASIKELGDIAVFVYVPITDAEVSDGLNDDTCEWLDSISESEFDRVMLKDKASMLYPLVAEKLKMEVSEHCDFKPADIGICGSPLSFRCGDEPGQACLTAVWARTIMSNYASADDIVVPSASHESMDCCGCIRYFVVDHDLPAPLSSKEKSEANKASKGNNDKEPKQVKPKAKLVWDSDL